tara:strand:+ start:305 stop:457 length:153 start_codon:yes stop_codon:yes gene_type:complete
MIKMEVDEIRLLLSLIENAQIQGSLAPTMASIIEKLQKEFVKMEGQNGKK